jgi:DNA mismatch repair ATPase MutS
MKAFLMHREEDFDLQRPSSPQAAALVQDLELQTLFEAMACGDDFLLKVAQQAVLSSLEDLDAIRYRQEILQDCLRNPDVVRAIYQIPIEAMLKKRKSWMGIFGSYPGGVLSGAVQMVHMLMDLLKRLKQLADEHADQFQSAGFTRFFAMLREELSDDYFDEVQAHLAQLKFKNGVLISLSLGRGNEGAGYVLRKPHDSDQNWLERLLAPKPQTFTFRIHPRDDHGARAVSEIRSRGINLAANALAQSADHIESFMNMLRIELAFYVGCLNLAEQLTGLGAPITFPTPAPTGVRRHTFRGLYDACLALTLQKKVVGNDVTADHKELVIITGANQGGKSTFLRSIGLAQLLMACGMFVPAESFQANLCRGLFSHFRREEDVTMESGKLEEELGRMSDIVDWVKPDSMVVFNESFAATNEREGSEIAWQVVRALLERRVKVFFVTHLYQFARVVYEKNLDSALFLRAERRPDGSRTFRLNLGEPLPTSFGADLYAQLFETRPELGACVSKP